MVNEEYSLLGCNAVKFGERLTPERNISSPYLGPKGIRSKKPADTGDKLGVGYF
jgi:hypothetical protein